MRPLILWHILVAYLLLLSWGVGIVEIIFHLTLTLAPKPAFRCPNR